jgi:hypothetical protein
MILEILETALLSIGFAVLAASIVMYLKRTSHYKAVLCFWQSEMSLSHREFIINRVGFIMMFMGIMLRFGNSWIAA